MADAFQTREPSILIRIRREWHPALTRDQLYERTRRYWRIEPKKHRPEPRYAFCIADGEVKAAYKIERWETYPDMAKEKIDPTRKVTDRKHQAGQKRTGFLGKPAEEMSGLVGTSVKHLLKRGNASPVMYLNC